MIENFQQIEKWLNDNASKILKQSLQDPATSDEIFELEQRIGKNIPDDFKALYLWHNGLSDDENFGSLFFGIDFFPIDRIIADYIDKKENYSNEAFPLDKSDPEIDPSNIYNNNWIKFAFDGSHTGLYLDLAPSTNGTYGQIIFIDDEYSAGILVAKSTTTLIANFAEDLTKNLYHLDEDALEDGNHYLTTDPKIDIVNWEMSDRWRR
jgi:cell wall assembly regulator SMI1